MLLHYNMVIRVAWRGKADRPEAATALRGVGSNERGGVQDGTSGRQTSHVYASFEVLTLR